MDADFAAPDRDLTGQQFLLGTAVSVGDIACVAYLLCEDMGLNRSQWPAMHAWMERIRALPEWRDAATLLRGAD